jgi:hypothetical protein
MYKIGDKVRPVAKTVGMPWDQCGAIREMERLNQDFLYVTYVYNRNTFGCNVMDEDIVLSEFALSDLEPYEESSNLIEVDRTSLLQLLQENFFKEDVRFFISK